MGLIMKILHFGFFPCKNETTDRYFGWVNEAFDVGRTVIQIDNSEVPLNPSTGEDTI